MSIKTFIAIIFLRLFSALPFAVYYSSFQLYLLNTNIPKNIAISLVGSVLALSYGSALIGGYVAGRYISYRALFIFCLLCEAAGCLTFTTLNPVHILWFSSLFLLGSTGITVSINMMVTQYYEPHDDRRDKAFFWLYMSLNIGYLIGYSLSGYYGNINAYGEIPIFVLCCALFTIFLCFFNWKQIDKTNLIYNKNNISYILLILTVWFFTIRLLLQFSELTNVSIIITWFLLAFSMFFLLKKNYLSNKIDIITFYILLFSALIFWSLYFLAPMALIIFIKHNVSLTIFNISIAPQWIQNINTLIIILGTIMIGSKAAKKLSTTQKITRQFSLGLSFMGLGFAALVIGILLDHVVGKISLSWVVLSYILQSLGELLIGPISYALVGRLIPKSHHSFMMGIWITLLGVANSISSKLSSMAPYYSPGGLHSNLTQYQFFFASISIIAILVAVITYITSFKLIKPKLII